MTITRRTVAEGIISDRQDPDEWRKEQLEALNDQQRGMYKTFADLERADLNHMEFAFKQSREPLIEEEFRKRLLHHPAPALSMLPVAPKTQDRIRQEATHAVDHAHYSNMERAKHESRDRLDMFLMSAQSERIKQAEIERGRQQEKAELFMGQAPRDREKEELAKAASHAAKQEMLSVNGKTLTGPILMSDYFTKREAQALLGEKVTKRTDYGVHEGGERLSRGTPGEIFRIEHVMHGAYEVGVAWGQENATRLVMDYDKHLFSDDVELDRKLELEETMENKREHPAPDLYDPGRVTITKGDIVRDLNIEGHLTHMPEYEFRAKVYDAPSPYGIDGGRVSKLEVYKGDEEILTYQRSWAEGEGPDHHTPEQARVLAEIQAGFPEVTHERSKAHAGAHDHAPSRWDGRGGGWQR